VSANACAGTLQEAISGVVGDPSHRIAAGRVAAAPAAGREDSLSVD
jgi:hypothetical protein